MRSQISAVSKGRRDKTERIRIAVDLTPLLPGGENGGAKQVTIQLVENLAQLAPELEFLLLTSDRSHEELAALERPNVHLVRTSPSGGRQLPRSIVPARVIRRLRGKISGLLRFVLQVSRFDRRPGPLSQLGVDLLFCPFTAPLFYDPTVPLVSIVYDLQYLYFPHFFESSDRDERDRNFRRACRLANKLVCISDFVRSTVLENSNLTPDRAITIPIGLRRLDEPDQKTGDTILKRHDLIANEYLLFPANFWPHKNHAMLLTAFGMYRAQHPGSPLKLVCTGALEKQSGPLREASRTMGLANHVIFPGYVPEIELAAILYGSLALIFASLYEGFGIPILQAMRAGKPVLCSHATSLPEVAGDAAIYFDPKKPKEIAKAIERLTTEPSMIAALVERGRFRANAFGEADQMAAQYLQVFCELLDTSAKVSSETLVSLR